jgi:hypothetical protein
MTTWTRIDSTKIENNAKYIRDGKAFIRAVDNDGNESPFELILYGYGISAIDPNLDTVVLTHGWLGDKTAVFEDMSGKSNIDLINLNAPYIPQLADNLSDYQVLYLDWSSAALEQTIFGKAPPI